MSVRICLLRQFLVEKNIRRPLYPTLTQKRPRTQDPCSSRLQLALVTLPGHTVPRALADVVSRLAALLW